MNEDLKSQLVKIGKDAQKASHILSMANEDTKNSALTNMADLIDSNSNEIIEANNVDMENAKQKGITDSFLDRLYLDEDLSLIHI